jgi:hypothetical protein
MVFALAAACTALTGNGLAADRVELTGTWKGTVTHGGKQREVSVKLKLEDGKLTGWMVGKGGKKMNVEDGAYRNGEVSFKVPGKTAAGKDMVHKYHGKLQGNTIKGKATIELPEGTHTSDWEAKRATD